MPIAGDVVRAAARGSAVRSIDQVLSKAAHRAGEVADEVLIQQARKPFAMVELDQSEVAAFTKSFRERLVWTDEGNCFNRAMYGAHLLNRTARSGQGPVDDIFAGAIAVSPHQHLSGGYDGGFHAALAVKVRGLDEVQVIDLLPGNPDLQPLSAWSKSDEPLVLRPFAGTGLWDGVGNRSTWVGSDFFHGAASRLRTSWNEAETYGVKVVQH